jgi:hypothetical protein
MEYGKEHTVKAAKRTKVESGRGGRKESIQRAVYGEKQLSRVTVGEISQELDLAMAMYWSNSVNAPGAARVRLERALRAIHPETPMTAPGRFARVLIRKLGNTGFARWDDDLKNGRYQRTRRYALKSDLWGRELFVGTNPIFPKNLPG